MDLNKDVEWIIVWVPGTGGHAVHPDFEKAVNKQLKKDNFQLLCSDYMASWDLETSVADGASKLSKLLHDLVDNKAEHQKILVGGSSQGAWVISEVFASFPSLFDEVHKIVGFGHPGLADHHDHSYMDGEKYWEINDPKDAVTFGWNGRQDEVINAWCKLASGNPLGFFTLLKFLVKYPVRLPKFIMLVLFRLPGFGAFRSPHDYSHQMPLAVYWLTH